MYKKERWLPSNTAMLAQSCLVNSQLFLRGLPNEKLTAHFLDQENYQPLYLYPSDDAEELTTDVTKRYDKPIHLIVPDGTWRQTKNIHQREKLLSDIPRVKLAQTPPTRYPLRRQKYEFGLCTHEAISYALGVLENKNVQDLMLENLDVMVAAHLKNRPIFEKEKIHKGWSVKNQTKRPL
tara:strand:- start:9575 stop:10114 length:540 start_codon:yes stop_codon:yes gene_type:complete